ncbi:Thiazole tautomerase TenI [Helicobacter heilmannii]|uniref:thiamine phosphate synthase n=1 Tax=Helicobacter heilmannii TaxID=35817 RepID=UPI0006A1C379|nr:thiamine phosphate synthase [Helicobacter heilmannii]CRF48708.1 Thiazole tautomerase TenI [Helicobacter heilmannii]
MGSLISSGVFVLDSYFITPENWQTLSLKEFEGCLAQVLKTHTPSRACLRQVGSNPPPSATLCATFVRLCIAFKVVPYINCQNPQESLDRALNYGFRGVHLKSHVLDFAPKIPKHLQIFYSAHSIDEVQEALDCSVHFCTLSPIFATPNKPPPLGLDYFNALSPALKARVFALGGITTPRHIELVKNLHLKGFASIRYFLNP